LAVPPDGLRGKLAPASIIKVHAVLRVALADAERMDLVTAQRRQGGYASGPRPEAYGVL
jgi:hypothetical protein